MWIDVPGHPGLQVNSKHEFKNTLGHNRILKVSRGPYGYPVIGYNSRIAYVHRLLALTFLPNPDNKKSVRHKNGISADNRLANLEWITPTGRIRKLSRKRRSSGYRHYAQLVKDYVGNYLVIRRRQSWLKLF